MEHVLVMHTYLIGVKYYYSPPIIYHTYSHSTNNLQPCHNLIINIISIVEILFQLSKIHGINSLGVMDELKILFYITACEDPPSLDVDNSQYKKQYCRRNHIL